ncbi:hypothetical protein SERLADRAFT_404637 [Serpula lacrymans var. lacrymans S7.9]|uniref:Uncharacterized protein n=1 Tax=Serpula lacrymans var. lacrymans (strain S7.9) TaxID=578457 RepID=F8NEB3_SERL9|nr:uncharacterized protein SERLADRAFT_404637 [Serpula lacrymans var. lacrymans S7.9]EGO30495.1 hypothetical protein SERLADRAFT_404637 [Serpula lacrymans var. lacrymans S7.9]
MYWYHVAQTAQIEVNPAREETRALRRKLNDLLNENKNPESENEQQSPSKKQELMGTSSQLQRNIKLVKQLGQKYLLTSLLWMHDPITTFKTPLDDEYDPLFRFENTDKKVQGQLHGIHEIIPRELREIISQDWFISAVISCIVQGPGSIFSTRKGTPYDGAQSTETLNVQWGLQHTTPGMIASAAVLVPFPNTKSGLGGQLDNEDRSEEMQEVMGALKENTEKLPLDNEEQDDRGINGEDVPVWQYGNNDFEFGVGGSQREGKV